MSDRMPDMPDCSNCFNVCHIKCISTCFSDITAYQVSRPDGDHWEVSSFCVKSNPLVVDPAMENSQSSRSPRLLLLLLFFFLVFICWGVRFRTSVLVLVISLWFVVHRPRGVHVVSSHGRRFIMWPRLMHALWWELQCSTIYPRVNVYIDVESPWRNPRKIVYKWLIFHI